MSAHCPLDENEQRPLDENEQRELEELAALEADGPLEEERRARLAALSARPGAPAELDSLHRLVAHAYRESTAEQRAERLLDSPRDFLGKLGQRIERCEVSRLRRRRLALAAAAALLATTGTWWFSRNLTPLELPSPEPLVGSTEEFDSMRLEGARTRIKAALRSTDAEDDEAFLEQFASATEGLGRWPLDVLVLRQVERHLADPTPDAEHLLVVHRALRWLGLARPAGAERVLEKALLQPELAPKACRALADYGTPRAVRHISKLAAHPEDFPFAPDALARSGLRGIHRLLDLWDGELTPEPIRTALARDTRALEAALAERIAMGRLAPALLPLLEEHAQAACREAFAQRKRRAGLNAHERALAVALGGELILREVLVSGAAQSESAREPYAATAAGILARAGDGAPSLALRALGEGERGPAVLLLRAAARLEPAQTAPTLLALLDGAALEEELAASLLLRLAALPLAKTPGLELALRQRLAEREYPDLVVAALLVALSARLGGEEAIALLAWQRMTPTRRVRLLRRLEEARREDPGVAGLAALRRLEPLIATYRS